MIIERNADQQRAAKQSTDGAVTGFLYDYKRLLCETDTVGGAISQTYASDTTDEFGDLIGEDGQYIHQYDAQANTNALLDETGTVAAQHKYLAFGQVSAVSIDGGPWTAEDWESLPLDFTSNMLAGGRKQYYLDQEIALYLLGSGNNGRYYDAAAGRFLSEDPTREAGGDADLYRYAGNDPINNLDPSGHDAKHAYHPPQTQPGQGPNANLPPVHGHGGAATTPSSPATGSQIDATDHPQTIDDTVDNQRTIGATQPSASQSVLTKTAANAGVSSSNAISSTISARGISDLTSRKAQTLHAISSRPALPARPISSDGQIYQSKPETVYTLGNDSRAIAAHNELVDEALAGKPVDFSKDPYGFQHVQAVIEKEPSTGGLVGEGISLSTTAGELTGAVVKKVGEAVLPAIKGIIGKIASVVGEKLSSLVDNATESAGKLFGKAETKGAGEPLGRGSTGRTVLRNLGEKLKMDGAKADPGGQGIPARSGGGMKDARWPAKDGWVKMRNADNSVHWVQNTKTGEVDDFKFNDHK